MQSWGCLPAALASKAEKLLVPVTQHSAVTENTVMYVQLNRQVTLDGSRKQTSLWYQAHPVLGVFCSHWHLPKWTYKRPQDLLALLAPGQVRLKNHATIPPVTFQKLGKKKTKNNPLAITNLHSCEVGQQCPGHKPG